MNFYTKQHITKLSRVEEEQQQEEHDNGVQLQRRTRSRTRWWWSNEWWTRTGRRPRKRTRTRQELPGGGTKSTNEETNEIDKKPDARRPTDALEGEEHAAKVARGERARVERFRKSAEGKSARGEGTEIREEVPPGEILRENKSDEKDGED
jgi:hypothetical protein